MRPVTLPTAEGRLEAYHIRNAPLPLPTEDSAPPRFNRVAYAAGHVVADARADNDPWIDAAIDWDKTIAFRSYLWDLGFGVAEAMDTAQRGMGLGWPDAQELIRRALAAAKERPEALIACGAGTDHLAPGPDVSIDDVIGAYETQIEAIERLGGRIILMASRALARAARGPADYERVYDRILSQVKEPVIIHWLGEMFDPALAGYWGDEDHGKAMQTCLEVVAGHADKVDGVKISLLSKEKEIAMRRRLAQGVRMYTGDDFNYAELVEGDSQGLLRCPARHLRCHRAGRLGRPGQARRRTTAPASTSSSPPPCRCRAMSSRRRRDFYKTGVVFLAYLNGLQDHFVMIGGQQSARSLVHLAELFRLADAARVLRDPELAASRISAVLATGGIA